MNRISILRVMLSLYLLMSSALPYVILNPSLPLEALNYMRMVDAANSGIDLSNLLSKVAYVFGQIIGLVGVILLFINRGFGIKPLIFGGLVSFLGLIGMLPKYLPSVFTVQAVVVLCIYFYTFGVVTAFAAKK